MCSSSDSFLLYSRLNDNYQRDLDYSVGCLFSVLMFRPLVALTGGVRCCTEFGRAR